jgi:hypothetical protein
MLKDVLSASLRPATDSALALTKRFWPYIYGVRRGALYAALIASLIPFVSASLLWLAKLIVDDVFIGALPLLHASNSHDRDARYFRGRNERSRQAELGAARLQSAMSFWIEMLAAPGALAVLAIAMADIRSGAITVGALVADGPCRELFAPQLAQTIRPVA